MNSRAFPRPSSPSPAVQRVERQKWREFLGDVQRLGRIAAEGGALTRDQVYGLQREVYRGAATTPFPVQGSDARAMLRAFEPLVGAFIGSGCKNPRLSAVLACAAEHLDALLGDQVQSEADTWRRQFPDD